MKISPNTLVIIEYSVRLKDGSYVKGEKAPVSLNFVVGYDQILPALEHRLIGLNDGDVSDFVIPAAHAFGQRDPGKVHRRTFSDFPAGRSLQVGKWIIAKNEPSQAQYSYFVRTKTEDWVELDFNHPLAGEDLFYHVAVTHVRPATEEEIQDLRPCEAGSEDEPAPGSEPNATQ